MPLLPPAPRPHSRHRGTPRGPPPPTRRRTRRRPDDRVRAQQPRSPVERRAYASLLELAEACDVPVRSVVPHRRSYNRDMTPSQAPSTNPDPVEPPTGGSALICCSQPHDDVVLICDRQPPGPGPPISLQARISGRGRGVRFDYRITPVRDARGQHTTSPRPAFVIAGVSRRRRWGSCLARIPRTHATRPQAAASRSAPPRSPR